MSEPIAHRPTLLIIDDDRAIRRLLARIAERSGFRVDTAKDGVQAMEMMGRKAYDIAVVDLMMPRLSGYELIERISGLVPRPTVLVATALMNGDVDHLDDSMVRRVIKKPFDIAAVANALVETAREIAARRAGEGPPGSAVVAPGAAAVPPTNVKIITGDIRAPQETTPEAPPEPPLPPPEKKIG